MNLLRRSILSTFGGALCLGLNTISQMILSRKLGPAGMGQYQLLLQTAVLISTLAPLGIGQANIYFINRVKIAQDVAVSNALYWWFSVSIFVAFLSYSILTGFTGYFGEIPLPVIFVFVLGIVATFLVNLLRPVLTANLQVMESAVVTTALAASYLLMTTAFALARELKVDTAVAAMTISNVVSAFVLAWYLRHSFKNIKRFNRTIFGRVIAYSSKLFLSNLVSVANSSLMFFVLRGLMKDDFSQIGYFGRALAVSGLLNFAVSAVTPLLYAKWSSGSHHERLVQIERALRMATAASLAFLGGAALFGRHAIIILYGAPFLPALIPMYIMVLGTVFHCITNIYSYIFAADGRPALNILAFGISIPVMVTAMFALVPGLGIVGAAWAYTVGSFLSMLLAIYVGWRIYSVRVTMSFLLNRSDISYIGRSLFSRPQTLGP